MSDPRRTIAVLPWGDVVEDYLAPIGWSLDRFLREGSGGWLFGYLEAIALAGWSPRLVLWSWDRRSPSVEKLAVGDTRVRVLPAARPYRAIRRLLGEPYPWLFSSSAFLARFPRPLRPAYALARDVSPYLATPRRALASVLREEGCHALLCQEYEDPRFDVAVTAASRVGIPVFATFQGASGLARSRLEPRRRKRSLAAAAGLFIGSRREISRVERAYGVERERIHYVHNPLDHRLWYPEDRVEARKAFGLDPDAPVLAWHGRVQIRDKGLDLLLEAWRRVLPQLSRNASLVLIGGGSDAAELRTRIESTLPARNVHWIDRYVADRGEVRRWLSAADVYAFPSRREGFPVAPLEAMACGLPVVATSASGIDDIFPGGETDGGIVVPIDDVDAFAAANLDLLLDPARRGELARAAQRRATTAFSLESLTHTLTRALPP